MAKDRTLYENVRVAAVNLRIAGMSERAIYEGLRDVLAEPPSYRDLRAAFRDENVGTRSEAAARRRERAFLDAGVEHPQESTKYRSQLDLALSVDKTSDAKDAFDRRFILGYLARAGTDVDLIEDEGFAESLADIYEDEGS